MIEAIRHCKSSVVEWLRHMSGDEHEPFQWFRSMMSFSDVVLRHVVQWCRNVCRKVSRVSVSGISNVSECRVEFFTRPEPSWRVEEKTMIMSSDAPLGLETYWYELAVSNSSRATLGFLKRGIQLELCLTRFSLASRLVVCLMWYSMNVRCRHCRYRGTCLARRGSPIFAEI
jgi:hypothetical protein